MKVNSEADLIALGKKYGEKIFSHANLADGPIVIELLGDVGAGKTTFTRGLATALRVTDTVTSPSFTISKTYAVKDEAGTPCTLTHYDFYRLNDPGIMVDDLAEHLTPFNIIVVEWGASVQDFLPNPHHIVKITYTDVNSREVTFL